MITRRGLVTGLAGILAAPAIVRASSIMPVKPWVEEPVLYRAYEHMLNGPFGTIPVTLDPTLPLDAVIHIGAGERVYAHDLVVIKDGLAWRARPNDMFGEADVRMGIALHGSLVQPRPIPDAVVRAFFGSMPTSA